MNLAGCRNTVCILLQFSCDGGRGCPCGPSSIVNTGNNRFNCFICDYDLCRSCVERRLREQEPEHWNKASTGVTEVEVNTSMQSSPWAQPSPSSSSGRRSHADNDVQPSAPSLDALPVRVPEVPPPDSHDVSAPPPSYEDAVLKK